MKTKNLAINGLRGFSAFLVILTHIYGMAVSGGFFTDYGSSILGALGVNMFFMISGFLIIQSLSNHGNFKVFMKNRAIRIYPVFLALHFMIFAAGPVIDYEWFADINIYSYTINFFTNLFFLPGIFDLPLAQKNAWSLSYEFLFYLVAGLAFVCLRLDKSTKNALLTLLAAGTLVIMWFHPLAVFFVIGTAIFYMQLNKPPTIGNNLYTKYNGLLYLVLFFAAYNVNLYLSLVPAFVFFLSIVKEEGLVSKFLKTKPLQYLGDISYSLYLVHPFAFFPLKAVFSRYHSVIGNEYVNIALFGVTGTILSIILAHFSYQLIEVKFTKNVLKKRRHKPATLTKPLSA